MIPKGWAGLLATTVADLEKIAPDIEIWNMTIRFGTLVIYFDPESVTSEQLDRVNARLKRTEQVSNVTCAECGSLASLYHKDMDVRPLCDEHNGGWSAI